MFYYNKRMLAIFNFESTFIQFLQESDMLPEEKHKLLTMKNTKPDNYYKVIENYYNYKYSPLNLSIIPTSLIQEYPTTFLLRELYILILFLKDLLGINIMSNSLTKDNNERLALIWFEWIPSYSYELFLKYLNPMAVAGGYCTTSLRVFMITAIISYIYNYHIINNQKEIKETKRIVHAVLNDLNNN